MTDIEELKVRRLVRSIGACSLYVQWARYYLQRTSDLMRDNLSRGINDALGEGGLSHSFDAEAVGDLDEMDRTLYATWRGLLATLAQTRQLLPPGSMPNLIVKVEDPPIPPTPRMPHY